ncbi:hypothetical protein WN55_04221 [Dufourea novaeangliae]|uniref:Uncharacterized protein n=1 Tax=Dufourea novaeangliae TaxID=178035 RepID=A0A154NVP9_DUFNO|nr:hypothetical protein WN55_04221 [Dufourea novaeangliae]
MGGGKNGTLLLRPGDGNACSRYRSRRVEHVYIVLPNYCKDLLLAYNSDSIRGILCAHLLPSIVTGCPTGN